MPFADSSARPPRILLAGIALAVVLGGWILTRLYTTDAARSCAEQYSTSRNAADSTRVDSLAPDPTKPQATCVLIRTNARWN